MQEFDFTSTPFDKAVLELNTIKMEDVGSTIYTRITNLIRDIYDVRDSAKRQKTIDDLVENITNAARRHRGTLQKGEGTSGS